MRSRDPLLLLTPVLLAACGDAAPPDLTLSSEPIAVVRGVVSDEAALAAAVGDGQLLITMAWVTQPATDVLCLRNSDKPEFTRTACRDPFTVDLAQFEGVVSFPGVGREVSLPINDLPSAKLGYSDAAGRVTYGSMILFEDRDGDGQLTIGRRGSGIGRIRISDDDLRRGGSSEEPEEVKQDKVLAASFSSLFMPQSRITFVEGTFGLGRLYLPLFSCDPWPDRGFATIDATFTIDFVNGTFGGTCNVKGAERPVTLHPLPDQVATALACPASSFGTSVSPELFEPAEDTNGICLTEDLYVVVAAEEDSCAGYTAWPLVGCWWDPVCGTPEGEEIENPNWDFRDDPPDWWTCK